MIKRPAGGEAQRLVGDLVGDPPERAEAAGARLLVLGARAVPHLVKALDASPGEIATARMLALLEALPASRGVVQAVDATLARSPASAPAVLAVWAAWLTAGDRTLATLAFDRLAAIALDEDRAGPLRVVALGAIQSMDDGAARALVGRLRLAEDPAVRVAASGEEVAPPASTPASENPEGVRRRLAALADSAPLTDLHHLLEEVRERQRGAADVQGQTAWLAVRAAVHQALAARGSTVALYDLREVLERLRTPPPVALVGALAVVGDATCIEALASAWDHVDDDWTRNQLRAALAAICARHGLTRRHAAVKRLVARGHALADAVPTTARRTSAR